MFSLKHHVFKSPVTESSYDYWTIYQNDKVVLISKRRDYIEDCFEKLAMLLKSREEIDTNVIQ